MSGRAHPEARRVAAEVAARWGVHVDPGVVRVVPRGVSGLDLPVWDESAKGLRYAPSTGAALSWRGGTPEAAARRRRLAANPAMNARRAEVARLHGLGQVMSEIVAAVGASWMTVRNDLRILGLAPHRRVALPPPPKVPKARVEQERAGAARVEDVARLFRQGLDDAAIAAALAVSCRAVRRARRAAGLRRASQDTLVAVRARRAEVVRRLAEGTAPEDVAAALGVSLAVVKTDARRAGVSPRLRRRPAAAARRAEVARLAAEGRTRDEILAVLGCAPHVLRDDCKRLGLRIASGRAARAAKARQERGRQVAALRAEGLTRNAIAARLDLDVHAVDRTIRQAAALGVAIPKPAPPRPPHLPAPGAIAARQAEVVRRTQAGQSARAIAAALGCGQSTVDSDRRVLGIGPGQGWRRVRKAEGGGHG